MKEPQEKVIGDSLYRVTPLMAGIGNKVLLRLGKAFAPALAEAGTLTTMEGAALVFGNLLSNLREEDFDYVVDALSSQTLVGNESKMVPLKSVFGTHFAGNYEDQLAWIAFALEVNFSFLTKLRDLNVGGLAKKAS